MSDRIEAAAAVARQAATDARDAKQRVFDLGGKAARTREEEGQLATLQLALPLLSAALTAAQKGLAGARARDAMDAVRSRSKDVPDPIERGGLTLLFDAAPELIADTQGNIVGIDAWVRGFRAGSEVRIDPHRRFINPPTQVADGGSEAVTSLRGERLTRDTFREDPWEGYLWCLFDSIATSPNPKGWRTRGTVDTFFGLTGDGYIESKNATYLTARSGSGTFTVDATYAYDIAGQAFFTPTYYFYESPFAFDTSSIADTATVSQVDLSGWISLNSGATNTVEARSSTWTPGGLTSADFTAGASLSGLTRVATLVTTSLATGAYYAFTEDGTNFRSAINLTGNTELMLSTSRQAAGNVPTADETVYFASANTAGTTSDPKLVVTYTASSNTTVTPAAVALTTSLTTPPIGKGVVPAAVANTLTGSTPAIIPGTVVYPAAKSLATALSTPPLAGAIVSVPLALVAAGAVPVLADVLSTSPVALVLTGSNAVVGRGVVPGSVAVALAFATPLIIPGTVIYPSALGLLTSLSAPTLADVLAGVAVALALTGSNAVVGGGVVPGAAALSLAGGTPPIGAGVVPAAISLIITKSTPGLSGTISPTPLALTLTGSVPVLKLVIFPSGAALIIGASTAAILQSAYGLGLRVDVYDVTGTTKQGSGPLRSVFEASYRQELNKIGSGRVLMAADDETAAYLAARRQLWIYKPGEGLVFRGKIVDRGTKVDIASNALSVELVSLEEDFVGANTGLGFVLTAASEQTAISTVIAGTGWTASWDSPVNTYTNRLDAKTLWQALEDLRAVFGHNMLADSITLSAGVPIRNIAMGAMGTDSGLFFRQVPAVTPQLRENTALVPIAGIEQHGLSRELWNSVVMLGPGDGYPTITLLAATHGANLDSDPCFLSGTTGWSMTGAGATIAQSSATDDPIDGNHAHSALVSYGGSGGAYYATRSYAISGATLGRIWSDRIRFYGRGTAVGKTAFVQINETGGAFGSQGSATTFTVVAGWQWVPFAYTLLRNDRTGLQLLVGFSSGAAAGETFNFRRIALWESTNYPYCVEALAGLGGTTEYTIEDQTSIAAYGRRVRYLSVPGMIPTVATKTAYIAACDGLYDIGRRFLDLHKAELLATSVQPTAMRHVSNGAQLIKPGMKSHVTYNGFVRQTTDSALRNWLTVDQALWLLAMERTMRADGSETWQLQMSDTDVRDLDWLEKFSKLYSDVQGNQTTLKQNNFAFSVPFGPVTINSTPSATIPTSVELRNLDMSNILAIEKVALQFHQVNGTASTIRLRMFYPDPSSPVTIADYTTPTATTVVDLTSYFRQSPTPVPWNATPDLAFPVLTSIGAAADLVLQGTLVFEATKLPVTPV